MCSPDSLDQTFEELSASDFASTSHSRNSSPARQYSMENTGQYGNGKQSAGELEFASSGPASDKSCMSRSPAISNLDTPSCQCSARALSILEDLEVSTFHPTKEIAPDHTLKCLRRCLQRCTEILECELLKWTSEILVLLTVICRKMLDAFDKLDSQAQLHYHNNNNKWSFPPPPLSLCSSLGKYHLESPEEIQCLINWLVLIQTKKLATFLTRLKKLSEEYYNYNWPGRRRHHHHSSSSSSSLLLIISLLGKRCLQLVRRLKRWDFITDTTG